MIQFRTELIHFKVQLKREINVLIYNSLNANNECIVPPQNLHIIKVNLNFLILKLKRLQPK